jgi:hypothetical protein
LFFAVSMVFVWRSFYGMRIQTAAKAQEAAPAPAPSTVS